MGKSLLKTHYLEIAREDIFKYVPIQIFQHPQLHQFKKWCPHNNLVLKGNRDLPNEIEEQNKYPYSVTKVGTSFKYTWSTWLFPSSPTPKHHAVFEAEDSQCGPHYFANTYLFPTDRINNHVNDNQCGFLELYELTLSGLQFVWVRLISAFPKVVCGVGNSVATLHTSQIMCKLVQVALRQLRSVDDSNVRSPLEGLWGSCFFNFQRPKGHCGNIKAIKCGRLAHWSHKIS